MEENERCCSAPCGEVHWHHIVCPFCKDKGSRPGKWLRKKMCIITAAGCSKCKKLGYMLECCCGKRLVTGDNFRIAMEVEE